MARFVGQAPQRERLWLPLFLLLVGLLVGWLLFVCHRCPTEQRNTMSSSHEPNPDSMEHEFRPGYLWRSKNSFIRMSSMSITSRADGYSVNETDIDTFAYHAEDNPYVSIHLSDANEQIRMIWMKPSGDVHANHNNKDDNGTYIWKLYSAWVSSTESKDGYYYWNVNNQDDSDLIIPSDKYDGLKCDYAEFNFRTKKSPSRTDKLPFAAQATLKFNDLEIGLWPDATEKPDFNNLELYNPCEFRICRAINGRVFCGAMRPWVVYSGILALILLSACLGCAAMFYCTREISARYKALSSDEYEADENSMEGEDDGIEIAEYRDNFEDEPVDGEDSEDDGGEYGDGNGTEMKFATPASE